MPISDLWTYLAGTDKPILLYGMGNGADKVLAVCAARGIAVADCFASDEFVRGQTFHGRTVLTYAEARQRYGQCIVLLSFATARPEVLARINAIAAEEELYVPDLPAYGDTLFDAAFVAEHRSELDESAALFCDMASRRLFHQVIEAKLTGSLALLRSTETSPEAVWQDILHPESYQAAADLGAYTGDTVRDLLTHAPNLTTVLAMEPDRRNFARLSAWGEAQTQIRLLPFQAAAWRCAQTLNFSNAGGRGSSVTSTGNAVRAEALDTLAAAWPRLDYIKYDVEGAEEEALLGSAQTISRCRPEMLVSLYHRSEDFIRLPALLRRLCPDYRFYLRRFRGLPAWDLNLYAVPNETSRKNL